MKKLLALILVLSCFLQHIEAQDIFKTTGFPGINKNFNLMVHVPVDSSSRQPIASDAFIDSLLNETAKYFEPIGVTFHNCEKNVIENYTFGRFVDSLRITEMQILYGKPHRINLYIINDIPFTYCGTSSFNGIQTSDDAHIFIERNCDDGLVLQLAHHLGHLFGLRDTYHLGNELVDGSNCDTEGDEICDTPADPFLSAVIIPFENEQIGYSTAMPLVIDSCEYKAKFVDSQNDEYKPDLTNIMSPYPCKCTFTDNQLRKMVENYNQSLFKQF